jgi:hypothetical protein
MPGGTGGQINPAPTHHAIRASLALANQLRYRCLPKWSAPRFRFSGHSVAKPGDAFGPPPGLFRPGCAHGKKRPLQDLGHGRVNDVSKCVKPASLNLSVPVVK